MKNVYLLILFALLNNFCHCQYKCYVCDGDESSCGDGGERKCQYDDSYTDPNFIYFCKYYPELGGNCIRDNSFLYVAYQNCMSVSNRFNKCTEGLCAYFHTEYQLCLSINDKCQLKKCEEVSDNCDKLKYCVQYNNSCKVNDCRGFITQEDCKNIESPELHYCRWVDNNCIEIPKCGGDNNDISKCSDYATSGDDYICFSDGEKCAESNSCENVKVTNIEGNQLLDLCSKYPHCEPGNNNDCINKCNII